ncbi:hypothetical protein [Azonexus sp.]|uniref:hypothetical protein n=1 Tax=Azonexus sp. TaxID=1872668 RepID=UPI0027BACED7|nr:hypothetical protein [Azonexus sp.]
MFIRLNANPAQRESLARLQALFAQACNQLGPIVRDTRCWNRVALHHLAYRKLRDSFPELGAQMVCNAIYSVCRSARLIYQAPASPWCITKNPEAALPLLQFAASAPVYFDRHTLNIRQGKLSMFTLDGRMRFELGLAPADETRFIEEKLKEVLLTRDEQGFFLAFSFGDEPESKNQSVELPEYLIVVDPEPKVLAA